MRGGGGQASSNCKPITTLSLHYVLSAANARQLMSAAHQLFTTSDLEKTKMSKIKIVNNLVITFDSTHTSPVAGLPYREGFVSKVGEGMHEFLLLPDMKNPHDPNAVQVWAHAPSGWGQIGFIPKDFYAKRMIFEALLLAQRKKVFLGVNGQIEKQQFGFLARANLPTGGAAQTAKKYLSENY
jgi:hypothetical protein